MAYFYIRAAPCEDVSEGTKICGQRMPRSACASAQADQGLRCPLTESLGTLESINEEQMPGRDIAHAWDDSESVHFAHAQRHIYAWRGPYRIQNPKYGTGCCHFVTREITFVTSCLLSCLHYAPSKKNFALTAVWSRPLFGRDAKIIFCLKSGE